MTRPGQVCGCYRYSLDERDGVRRSRRQKGLYREQIAGWRETSKRANDCKLAATNRIVRGTWDDRKRIQELERELVRKEKALAETAALIILRIKRVRCGGARRERANGLFPGSQEEWRPPLMKLLPLAHERRGPAGSWDCPRVCSVSERSARV